MASVFLLYVAALTLTGCNAACTKPSLWLFALSDDLQLLFPELTSGTFFLVENGIVADVLQSAEVAQQSVFSLPSAITQFPLTWCITFPESATYNLSLASLDQSSLKNPNVSIPNEGEISLQPYRFKVEFQCVQEVQQPITVMVMITIISDVAEFCPVIFYFSKRCNDLEAAQENTDNEIVDGFVTVSVDFKNSGDSSNGGISTGEIVVSAVIPSLLVLLALAILFIAWAIWYHMRSKSTLNFQPEVVSLAYQQVHSGGWNPRSPHEKEFSPSQLKLVRELGEGAFGVVYEGEAKDILELSVVTTVAVKQLKESSESDQVEEFFREVDFMSKLDHPRIVRLLGVCSLQEPFSMIFEYMDLGDLCSFLREASGLCGSDDEHESRSSLLSEVELLSMSQQVADGMMYISSLHLVHRDLATRNCLVATGLVVKIADFGMSRDVHSSDYYRVHGNAMLPVRWMSPESVLYGKFTTSTDVWSFGILLWEIFTFGQQPYTGQSNEEVIEVIKDGGHPVAPQDCSAAHLMLRCWDRVPKNRPTFQQVSQELEALCVTHDKL